MAQATETKVTSVVSPLIQFSYCNVTEARKPQQGKEGGPLVYDLSGIMNPPENLTPQDQERWKAILKLLVDTKANKWPNFKGTVQAPFRTEEGVQGKIFFSKPLDTENNPEYAGKWVIKAVSYGRAPQVIGPDKEEIFNKNEIYSGCYGRILVTAFASENPNKCVSLGLQGVWKIKDGEPLGGGVANIKGAFDGIETDNFDTVESESNDLTF